jgi:hypothetical protein
MLDMERCGFAAVLLNAPFFVAVLQKSGVVTSPTGITVPLALIVVIYSTALLSNAFQVWVLVNPDLSPDKLNSSQVFEMAFTFVYPLETRIDFMLSMFIIPERQHLSQFAGVTRKLTAINDPSTMADRFLFSIKIVLPLGMVITH